MSYDEEQQRRSRVVVETPRERREAVHTHTTRYPHERSGYSTGVVVAVALTAIAATAIIFLFLSTSGDDATETNVNLRAGVEPTPIVQTPVIVQTPLPMPTPLIIEQPPVTTMPAPVIITQPPGTTETTTAPPQTQPAPTAAPADDATLESRINKAYGEDEELARADIDLRVVNGKAILMGTVSSGVLKQRAERLAYAVKGVRSVENKIVVNAPTP